MYLVLIPHCMTEILAKECKSGKSTVLALGAVFIQARTERGVYSNTAGRGQISARILQAL